MLHICVCGKHPDSTCSIETAWPFRCKVVGAGTEGRSSGAFRRSWIYLSMCRGPLRRAVEDLKVTLVQVKLEQQGTVAVVSVALMSGTSKQPIRRGIWNGANHRTGTNVFPNFPSKARLKGPLHPFKSPFFINPFLPFKHHNNHTLFCKKAQIITPVFTDYTRLVLNTRLIALSSLSIPLLTRSLNP